MRQASKRIPESAEKTVRDIRGEPHVGIIRQKRRSALCWRAFAVKSALPSSAARKVSTRTSRQCRKNLSSGPSVWSLSSPSRYTLRLRSAHGHRPYTIASIA